MFYKAIEEYTLYGSIFKVVTADTKPGNEHFTPSREKAEELADKLNMALLFKEVRVWLDNRGKKLHLIFRGNALQFAIPARNEVWLFFNGFKKLEAATNLTTLSVWLLVNEFLMPNIQHLKNDKLATFLLVAKEYYTKYAPPISGQVTTDHVSTSLHKFLAR